MEDRERIERIERIERLEERLRAVEAGLEEIRHHFETSARRAAAEREAEARGQARPPVVGPTEATAPAEAPQTSATERVDLGTVRATLAGGRTGAPRWARAWLPRVPDLEAWFGQNALLVVGVLALVAAIGFTLKYAFEQGWISPAVRVLAGLAIGLGIFAYGERLLRQGLRRYGAAAQGAGAAVAYLAIWAAAGPYRFVPEAVGIGVLVVLSGLVLASAVRVSEEYLAGLAAAGAYLAPLLLGEAAGSADLLLVYSVLVSVSVGSIAAGRGWRTALLVVIVGYFVMPVAASGGDPDLALVALYLALGGAGLVLASRRHGWSLHELLAWTLAWIGLFVGAQGVEAWRAWFYVALPAVPVAPAWLATARAWGRDPAAAAGPSAIRQRDQRYVYGAAFAWVVVVAAAMPAPVEAWPLLVVGAIGLVYLAPGLTLPAPNLHVAGLAILAVGVPMQWDGSDVAMGLTALALVAGATTRSAPLAANRWAGTLLGGAAAYQLFRIDAMGRPEGEPALYGRWAGALYLTVASLAAIAGPLWRATEERWARPAGLDLRVATWLLAAFTALVGGTIEIPRFVAQQGGSGLAAGLAVSAYWLILAGAFLAFGFRRNRRAVRITGLSVAALAVAKVVLYDLATLRALYRVGSLALLALIALLGALAYHRRAPPEAR
jgi:uncharacterized membrane protein